MMEEIKKHYISLLKESEITDIKRICDLICFTFKTTENKKIFLHVQCFLRIYDNVNRLVICTQNMLDQSPTLKKKKFNWSETGTTVFDDAVKEFQAQMFSTKVFSVDFHHNDLEILFYNEMRMNVLITSTIYDDDKYSENYRIFDKENHKNDLVL